MRAGLVQLTSSDLPLENLPVIISAVREAAEGGADLVLTPETSNCISTSRRHQQAHLVREVDDPTLAALRETAADCGIWLLIGSLALATGDPDGRFANRSFLIGPDGAISARYDKIHMFDVAVTEQETFTESEGFRPGGTAVMAKAAGATIGLSICYDLRFPHLHRALAQAGAQIITVPAAFSPVTGAAHWEVLLRARAIETGSFVLAPAQTGAHPSGSGTSRSTHGHSLAVGPWGDILLDAGTAPGVSFVDLDLGDVAKARRRLPSLSHDRTFAGPV
ncbi:MAG: carbon-nitrogen hydrolase family protein [Pseudomonadota bacterium]